MVTSKQAHNHTWMRIGVNCVNVPFSTIKIGGVEDVIQPVHAPLILVSYPTHGAGQAGKGGNTSIAGIIIPNGFYYDGVSADIAVEPLNGIVIARGIVVTIGDIAGL